MQASMLAEASYLAATADEPVEMNCAQTYSGLIARANGCDIEAPPTGLLQCRRRLWRQCQHADLVSSWNDDEEIAHRLHQRKSFAINRKGKTSHQAAVLDSILGEVDMAYQNLDSIEIGVT